MNATIFLAGILQFENRSMFEAALEAVTTEEGYSESISLVPVFQAAMVSEGLMVLRHNSTHSPQHYDRLMAEAYLLSEFAGRGYIAGILLGPRPRVQVAMAAMTHPVIDPFKASPDPELSTDYFPRLENVELTYQYHSEGREVPVSWYVRTHRYGAFNYIYFPSEGSADPFNDWWDGHYFLKSGTQWFNVTTDLDAQALSDPAPEEIQLIMDGAAQPGQTFFSYVPGTESFRLYTHESFEDIETPIGEFRRCMKVRVDLYFLPTDESRYAAEDAEKAFKKVTTTHYFAKGVGLVKLMFEGGELALEKLVEVDAPPTSPAQLDAEGQSSTAEAPKERNANGGKPWWKFW